MFSKPLKLDSVVSPNRVIKTVNSSVPSIVSADLRIVGDLVCSGDVQIDGWVEGDIHSRNITVGEGATVRGSLQAEEVRIAGLLNGEIRADLVVLARTAQVNGDILHKSIAVEEGAFLEGMCRRLDTYTAPVIPGTIGPKGA